MEALNKLIVRQKLCASSWLISEINKYIYRLMLLVSAFERPSWGSSTWYEA